MRKICRDEGWSDSSWTAAGSWGAGSRITEETVQAATMLINVAPSVLLTKAKERGWLWRVMDRSSML
jgi:hypothetical protein